MNNANGYDAGIKTAVTVDDGSHFKVYDAVFNGNKQFLGIVTRIATNDLYFANGTNFNLVNDEKLYVADSTHKTAVLSGDPADIGSTTIKVDNGTDDTDSEATTVFSVGDKVYWVMVQF